MRWIRTLALLAVLALESGTAGKKPQMEHGYLGFDRNDYPGDAAMAELRKQFRFTGYWLTSPPAEKTNSWKGKHKILERQGYGFLLLARGRAPNRISNATAGQRGGVADAQAAAESAKSEGLPIGATIFLDVEDGGRLPAAYHAYLRGWADELMKQGFRPGVYCSGIPVDEGNGVTIITADDIRTNEGPRQFTFWVFNDSCPPSPGCVSPTNLPLPGASGVKDAAVWQFVRSPREKESAAKCAGYAADQNCYAAVDAARKWFLDMDIANSPNPSLAP